MLDIKQKACRLRCENVLCCLRSAISVLALALILRVVILSCLAFFCGLCSFAYAVRIILVSHGPVLVFDTLVRAFLVLLVDNLAPFTTRLNLRQTILKILSRKSNPMASPASECVAKSLDIPNAIDICRTDKFRVGPSHQFHSVAFDDGVLIIDVVHYYF